MISQSLFLPPIAPPAQPVVAPSTAAFANPFAVPATTAVPASLPAPTATTAVPAPHPAPTATAIPPQAAPPARPSGPVNSRVVLDQGSSEVAGTRRGLRDHGAAWDLQRISKADREAWWAAGMRPNEAELAGRCHSVGITPADLSMRLSGRTSLQRLRDGEATTSVWARIREAEQQPGKSGTKLTGRFQLS